MKISQMYSESKGFRLLFSLLGIIVFVISFYNENIIWKILGYTMLPFCIFYIIFYIYKFIQLKIEIKNNSTITLIIEIKDLFDIKTFAGTRSTSKFNYYGIKILSKNKKYYYYYKAILNDNSSFKLFNNLLNQKTIKIEVYKKSRVIKRILTKM